MRRSEGGSWKRPAYNGTSLAAYPTVRPVWGGADGKGAGYRYLAGGLLYACTSSPCFGQATATAAPGSRGGRKAGERRVTMIRHH